MVEREFFAQQADVVARQLIGKALFSTVNSPITMAQVVEAEAYMGPDDKAAHARHGITKRTEVLFNGPGYAYPHLIHGIHWLLNVTAGPVGGGQGVLIRAVQPLLGIHSKTNGPGLVGRAFGVTNNWYGLDMCTEALHFEDSDDKFLVGKTTRIGVSKFSDDWMYKKLRFIAMGNPHLSGSKLLNETADPVENGNG